MVFAAMVVLGITAFAAHYFIPSRLGLAQLIWQSGMASAVALLVLLLGRPEIAFLLALLPLMGSASMGWRGAVLGELVTTITALLLWQTDDLGGSAGTYVASILLGGAFSGVIGSVSSRSLYVVTHWSLDSFDQARQSRDDARHSRAQLEHRSSS